MEKRKNAEAIIIIVLLLILIGVVVFLFINSFNKNNIVLENNSGSTQQENSKQEYNVELEKQLKEKDEKIASLKKENDELKNKSTEVKVETITKNEYVRFDGKKVKRNGKYVSDSCTLYPVSVLYFEDGETAYYSMEINEKGGVTARYNTETYTVKGFIKKVVELYAMSDEQTAVESGIAIMEDGTIEQIYFDGSNFKTRGTISGVKDVVRLTYINVNGHRYAAAVQANGDVIVLSGLKNYYNPGM